MRYKVELDPRTSTLTVPELNITVEGGTLKENMRKLRELIPPPAVFLMPYLGGVHQTEWYDLDKERLTEERVGQWTTVPWYEDELLEEEEVTKIVKRRIGLDWDKQGGKRK